MNRTTAIALLPAYHATRVVDIPVGSNEQLQQLILQCYPMAVQQCRQLAPRFAGTTAADAPRNVWQFLKKQIRYKADTGLDQKAQLPAALITTGTGDCKSYTLFAAGILTCLGYQVTIRFTSYDSSRIPGHVYLLASKGGTTWVVDAVHKGPFNTEKPYTYKKDHPMRISVIAGIQPDTYTTTGPELVPGLGAIRLKAATQAAKKAAQTVKKVVTAPQKAAQKVIVKAAQTVAPKATTKVQAAVKKAAPVVKKAVVQQVKKSAGTPARNAFLALVSANAFGFATILAGKDRSKVSAKWANLGGNPAALWQAVDRAKGKKPLLRKDDKLGSPVGDVTVATVGTVLIAATPVVIALNEFLKVAGQTKQLLTTGKNAQTTPAGGSTDYTGGSGYDPTGGGASNTGGGVVVNTPGGGNSNTMLYLALVAAALLLFAPKKKTTTTQP